MSTEKDQQATDHANITPAAPATTADDASRYPKPYRDPSVTCDVVHDCYQHVWGGYLALARHFEATGDAEQAAIYNERFHHFCRFELDLWKLSDDEQWRHQEEVLPPLIKELHALEKEFLGYQRTGLPPA